VLKVIGYVMVAILFGTLLFAGVGFADSLLLSVAVTLGFAISSTVIVLRIVGTSPLIRAILGCALALIMTGASLIGGHFIFLRLGGRP
jgi:hypothetical protein